MNSRDLVEALRIPVAFTIAMWAIIFMMMVAIEAMELIF